MSDPKRTTLITVGAPISAKTNVKQTLRLTITLEESNKRHYSELNYKKLVLAEEEKSCDKNGKTDGLDPFSDNDDDVVRVARKFEQKYSGSSRPVKDRKKKKKDEYADIGAGYDENDSFIDNTDGYDEMMPPDCDTLYGGFYINSGSLEFKNAREDTETSDIPVNRKYKRRISSSSGLSEESSASSSESSQDEKDGKVTNGTEHSTEYRKKKNKKSDNKKPKKVRRTDSSAATSGKQTSDDNAGHGDAESIYCGDSRTSQSDSLPSKPAPASENPATSDSSRDAEVKFPAGIQQALDSLEASTDKSSSARPTTVLDSDQVLLSGRDHLLLELEESLKQCGAEARQRRAAWARAAAALGVSHYSVMQRLKLIHHLGNDADKETPTPVVTNTTTATTTTTVTTNNKRKREEEDTLDVSKLTDEQREEKVKETLQRLKALIDDRTPSMLANYNAECERVQEERRKLLMAKASEGGPHIEKRLPKRRFPWCARTRSLLARLTSLAGSQQDAAQLLAKRALPLFPAGFVRMPTLLRQADLSKEIKITDTKRQRLNSASQPTAAVIQTVPQTTPFPEPIQFPSSLTVTTTTKTSPEKTEPPSSNQGTIEKYNTASIYDRIEQSLSRNKDLIIEKEKRDEPNEDLYLPPNNIGSITITPVLNQTKEKPAKASVIVTDKPGLIRVKSPAALNDMVNKKKKEDMKVVKKQDKVSNSKRVESPLHIDTSYQPSKKDPSPKLSDGSKHSEGSKNADSKKDANQKAKDGITQKQIENMRVAENNIPRPALIPVHHSPTFAKPDKRPPEGKKKKDVIVVSDVDPLSDSAEPLNVDDSSSDVEVIETDKSDSVVPSQDKKSVKSVPKVPEEEDCPDFDTLLRGIQEMKHSQEQKFNSNSYGGVIATAQNELH